MQQATKHILGAGVFAPLHHNGVQSSLGQLQGRQAAGRPGPNDNDIKEFRHFPLLS